MNNYNNFVIFLENLSSVYILTTIVLFISVISVIFAKYFSRDIQSNEPTNFEASDNDEDEAEGHASNTYSKGLYGKMKSKSYLKLKKNLTEDQLLEEKAIEQEQLAAIFKLLKEQQDELETNEFNEDQLNEQLKLYR